MGWGRSYFDLGEMHMEIGSRHVKMPDLVQAQNVQRFSAKKTLGKRKGTTRQAMTFSGGSLSGSPEVILPGVDGNNYMRDTGGQNWVKSGTQWQLKSSQTIRPWVDTKVSNPVNFTQPRPKAVLVGTSIWQFAVKANGYEVTVISTTDGRITTAPFTVTATSVINVAPVWDGTDLWALWTDGGENVRCHKFASGTVTATPTATVYHNVSGRCFQVIDAKYMTGVAKTFAVYGGVTTIEIAAKIQVIYQSYLNPATGAASASPAPVLAWTRTDARYASGLSGLTIGAGQEAFANEFQYFAVTDKTTTADQEIWLGRCSVAPSTLAGTFTSEYQLGGMTGLVAVTPFAAAVSAVVHEDRVGGRGMATVYFVFYGSAGSILLYVLTNTSGSLLTFNKVLGWQDAWVASTPVLYGGVWYVLTATDDGASTTVTTPIQQGYFLRKMVGGEIVAQFLMGQGSARQHRNTLAVATTNATWASNFIALPNFLTYGTKLFATVAQTLNIGFVGVSTAIIEMAKAYGKPTQAMGYGIIPGNIPQVWGINGAHEIAPLIAPPWLTGTTAGTGSIAIRYVIRDSDGTLWRSAPIVKNSVAVTGTVAVSRMYYMLTGTSVSAEIYASASGSPKLQATIDCAPDYTGISPFVSYTFPATLLDGESLDTFGGALEQTWPIPCQAVGYWRNRVFLAQKNRLYYSRELEGGLGPLFNETLASEWTDSQSDINAVCTVNWDYLALFSHDRIGAIGGAGPDGLGRGNYTVQTLTTRMGLLMSSSGAVGSGPDGAYFQDAATGIICLVTPSLQIVDCGIAAKSFASWSVVKSVVHYEAGRVMLFSFPWDSINTWIVIDYMNRTESSPYGQVYYWTATSITVSASCIDSSGVAFIDSDGAIRRFGSVYYDEVAVGATNYSMMVSTGLYNPSGLQAEHLLSLVQVLLTRSADSSVIINVLVDNVTSTSKTFSVTSTAFQFGVRPTGAGRIQFVQIVITETNPTNQAFSIEGIAMEYYLRGRPKMLNSGSVL